MGCGVIPHPTFYLEANMIYDYTWLTELLTEFGQSYPAYFDATLGQNLPAIVVGFWFIVLWGFTHPYERRGNK